MKPCITVKPFAAAATAAVLSRERVHTICEESSCPNQPVCYRERTATFLLLGDRCTRHCRYCGVHHAKPEPPDGDEPRRVVESVAHLRLDYVVLTCVTRDDLPDQGIRHFRETVNRLKDHRPDIRIELLLPDLFGNPDLVQEACAFQADVFGHNVETASSIFPRHRPEGDYQRSLNVLSEFRRLLPSNKWVKSGFMVGLGEDEDDCRKTIDDIRSTGCQWLTIGQYLPPKTGNNARQVSTYSQKAFDRLADYARGKGFKAVASSPLVRSSYRARSYYHQLMENSLDD